MKRKIYVYENNKTILILIALILFLSLLAIPSLIHIIVSKDFSFTALFNLILFGGATIYFISSLIKTIKQRQKDKIIKENGIRLDGKIMQPIADLQVDSDGGKYYQYSLLIRYTDPNTNQEMEFKTYELDFNPYKKLKDDRCNVFLYNNEVYAMDFNYIEKGEKALWIAEDPEGNKASIIWLILIMACIIPMLVILLFILGY